jgi:hypothetical protein
MDGRPRQARRVEDDAGYVARLAASLAAVGHALTAARLKNDVLSPGSWSLESQAERWACPFLFLGFVPSLPAERVAAFLGQTNGEGERPAGDPVFLVQMRGCIDDFAQALLRMTCPATGSGQRSMTTRDGRPDLRDGTTNMTDPFEPLRLAALDLEHQAGNVLHSTGPDRAEFARRLGNGVRALEAARDRLLSLGLPAADGRYAGGRAVWEWGVKHALTELIRAGRQVERTAREAPPLPDPAGEGTAEYLRRVEARNQAVQTYTAAAAELRNAAENLGRLTTFLAPPSAAADSPSAPAAVDDILAEQRRDAERRKEQERQEQEDAAWWGELRAAFHAVRYCTTDTVRKELGRHPTFEEVYQRWAGHIVTLGRLLAERGLLPEEVGPPSVEETPDQAKWFAVHLVRLGAEGKADEVARLLKEASDLPFAPGVNDWLRRRLEADILGYKTLARQGPEGCWPVVQEEEPDPERLMRGACQTSLAVLDALELTPLGRASTGEETVNSLWQVSRDLARYGHAPAPPELPGPVSDRRAARRAVDAMLRWCDTTFGGNGAQDVNAICGGTAADDPAKRASKGKRINERMMKMLQEDATRLGWGVRDWAGRLKCSLSTVQETQAWQTILNTRKMAEAENLTRRKKYPGADRRRFGKRRSEDA